MSTADATTPGERPHGALPNHAYEALPPDVQTARPVTPGIEVIVGPVEELNDELVRRGRPVFPSAANVYGWVLQGDGGAIGIWHPEDQEWPDLVVSVADIIQEGIIEGTEHWGVAFPMCAVHPNHPMEAQVVNAGAGWVCPKGAGEPVPIGRIRLTKSS